MLKFSRLYLSASPTLYILQEYRDNLVAKELWIDENYKQYKVDLEETYAEYVLRDADFKRYKKEKKKAR